MPRQARLIQGSNDLIRRLDVLGQPEKQNCVALWRRRNMNLRTKGSLQPGRHFVGRNAAHAEILKDRPHVFGNVRRAAPPNNGGRLRHQSLVGNNARKIARKNYVYPIVTQDGAREGENLVWRQRPPGAQGYKIIPLGNSRIDLEAEMKSIPENGVDKGRQRHLFYRQTSRCARQRKRSFWTDRRLGRARRRRAAEDRSVASRARCDQRTARNQGSRLFAFL